MKHLLLHPYYKHRKIFHNICATYMCANNYYCEYYVSQHTAFSYNYVTEVIKAPFPKGEQAIAKDSFYAYRYATSILKGRFKQGEHSISKNGFDSVRYASHILKGRFKQCEPNIMQTSFRERYLDLHNSKLAKQLSAKYPDNRPNHIKLRF